MENKHTCNVDMEIHDDGTFEITKLKNPKHCKTILDKVNPVRGVLYKSNIKESEKKKAGIKD